MTKFQLPADLRYNRGLVQDPSAYADLEALPRPTLVTCRTGPRASAAAYLYAGLKRGASYEELLAAAEQDNAPFCDAAEIKEWLRSSLEALGGDGNAG
jgi:hypothetical protein